jgi:hypothetical protein
MMRRRAKISQAGDREEYPAGPDLRADAMTIRVRLDPDRTARVFQRQ